jgi:hypothetical protein
MTEQHTLPSLNGAGPNEDVDTRRALAFGGGLSKSNIIDFRVNPCIWSLLSLSFENIDLPNISKFTDDFYFH